MNKDKMIEWIGCHRVGISSRTMWCAIMGVKCSEADVLGDADDFRDVTTFIGFAN